jgi:tRNA(Arg) A34 adenosine deaminase TadA
MVAMDDFILHRQQDLAILRACRLYVTCKPSIMCAAALGKVGIQSVYFANLVASMNDLEEMAPYCQYIVISELKLQSPNYFLVS